MGDASGQNFDLAALLVIVLVVCVLVAVGIMVLHKRRLDPHRRTSKGVKIRLDVMRRDLDRMAEYIGELRDAELAVSQPFELGLAAMTACHWDKAIEHFHEAWARASRSQLVPLTVQIGVCHYMQGSLFDALKEFKGSTDLAEREGDKQGKAAALADLGVIQHEYGELGNALTFLNEALAIARESGNQRVVALCLGNIGNVQRDKGEIDNALKSQEDALALSLRIGDKQGVVSGLGNIGSILRDKGEFDKALEQYAEALDTANKNEYKLGAALYLGNIGEVHRDQGDTHKALKFHEDALALGREVGYQMGVATELGNIGLILANKGTYEQAVPKLAESLTILLAAGAARGPLQALYGLSTCDDKLGRERMEELLKQAGLADAGIADMLDRVDQIRTRRPRQTGGGRGPFAPAA